MPIFTDIAVRFDDEKQSVINKIFKENDQISNINVFIEEAMKTIK